MKIYKSGIQVPEVTDEVSGEGEAIVNLLSTITQMAEVIDRMMDASNVTAAAINIIHNETAAEINNIHNEIYEMRSRQ